MDEKSQAGKRQPLCTGYRWASIILCLFVGLTLNFVIIRAVEINNKLVDWLLKN